MMRIEDDEDDWFLPPLSNFSPEVAVVQGSCEALLLPLLLLAEPAAHDSIGGPTNLRDQDDNDDEDDDAIRGQLIFEVETKMIRMI